MNTILHVLVNYALFVVALNRLHGVVAPGWGGSIKVKVGVASR